MPDLADNRDAKGAEPPAVSSLARLRDSFRAWLKCNARAHARAKPRACCSAPPPGAGVPAADRGDNA